MKAFARVFGWMAIVGAVVLSASVSMAESLGAMRLVIEQGDVQVKIADTGEWVPASVNMPIVDGDELWVPEASRAALQTNNGAHIRLDGDTALQVLRVDRGSFQFYLAQGYAYVLSLAPNRGVLQFDTPDASIRAFGNATFRIDIPGGERTFPCSRDRSWRRTTPERRPSVRAACWLWARTATRSIPRCFLPTTGKGGTGIGTAASSRAGKASGVCRRSSGCIPATSMRMAVG